jgi:hypothetical protein
MTNTTPNKKAAGGLTTPATSKTHKPTLSLFSQTKAALFRFASLLAVMFRGVL